MAQQAQINIELRTTWIMLAFRFFAWLESPRLLTLLDNCIFARMYVDGKASGEMRFNITNKYQISIRIDSPGGEVENISDIKL